METSPWVCATNTVASPNSLLCAGNLPLRPAPRQTNPSGEQAEEDHVEQNATTATTVNTTKGKCCVCLHSVVWALPEMHFGGCLKPVTVPQLFPACKHFHRTSLESGGAVLHRTVVFIYLRVKAWPRRRSFSCSVSAAALWSYSDECQTYYISLRCLVSVLLCWKHMLFNIHMNFNRNRVLCGSR